jgi:integrase
MWDPLDERTYFKAQPQAGLRIPADDFDRILDAAPFPRDRALMAVGLHTLLRQSEIITLRVGDLDLAKGELEVQIWKSDKADTLLISEDFGEELVRWLAAYTAQCGPLQPDWYLIPAQRNDGFSTYRIDGTRAISHSERIVRRVLEAAGYSNDRMGIHDLRRSGARAQWDEFAAVNEPNAIRFVSNQMHHSETSTTERYIGRDIDKIGLDNFRRNNPTYPSLVAKRAAAAAAQVPEEPVVGLRLVPPLPDEDDEGGVAAMTYGN